jgi:hypothetical protein
MPKQSNAIPKGMRQLQSGGLAPFHDFKKNPVLYGTVIKIREFVDRWKNKRKVIEVSDSDGLISAVSSSKSLDALFSEAKKGKKVYIRFDGTKKIPGRKQPMKMYTTAI